MGVFDIVVVVLTGVAVIAVVTFAIIKKVRHKGCGCGCGCENCPNSCHKKSDA